MDNYNDKVSEWNEAQFFTIRLHQLQSAINLLKMNPLGRTDGKFNYEWLIQNIDALYHEGYAKYSPTERKTVDKIRNMIFKCQKFLPAHKKKITKTFSEGKEYYEFNEDNYERIMHLIESFLRIVKEYNETHGLTTKNKSTGGLF